MKTKYAVTIVLVFVIVLSFLLWEYARPFDDGGSAYLMPFPSIETQEESQKDQLTGKKLIDYSSSVASLREQFIRYFDRDNTFEIYFPNNWKVSTSTQSQDLVVVLELERDANNDPRSTLTVFRSPGKAVKLDEYIKNLTNPSARWGNATDLPFVVDSWIVKVNNERFQCLEMTLGESSKLGLACFIAVANGDVFEFHENLLGESFQKETFNDYVMRHQDVLDIISTFRFLE